MPVRHNFWLLHSEFLWIWFSQGQVRCEENILWSCSSWIWCIQVKQFPPITFSGFTKAYGLTLGFHSKLVTEVLKEQQWDWGKYWKRTSASGRILPRWTLRHRPHSLVGCSYSKSMEVRRTRPGLEVFSDPNVTWIKIKKIINVMH